MGEASATVFAETWESAVRNHGSLPFLVFRDDGDVDHQYTYSEFDRIVRDVEDFLRALGVDAGSGVHMCLQNCPGFIAVWLAVARMGAWMIPVDPSSSPRDLQNQIERTRPVVGIVGRTRFAEYQSAAPDLPTVAILETAADLEVGGALRSSTDVADMPCERKVSDDDGRVSPSDRLAIMFTSGTTSEPKGVVLTQANYAYIARTMAQLASLGPAHCWFVTLPLFHGNAQYYCFAAAIEAGASVALTHRFSASRWVAQASELEVTHVSLFAAPIRMILAKTDPEAKSLSLTHVWYAQNLSQGHFARFAELCGVAPRQLYGMTETTAIVCCDLSDQPRHNTIGRVVPGREIALRSLRTDQRAEPHEPGVVLLAGERGHDLFLEYLDNPEANKRACVQFEDRQWFSTGDLVSQGRNGELSFVGREDDVIKVAGENVSLSEVEAALAEADGVLEVAVISTPDDIRDAVPAAFVVPENPDAPPTEGELRAFAEQNLPKAARPRYWEIVEALPKTSVGKIRRFKLSPG